MTNAIIRVCFSDGVEMFKLYVGSDAHPEIIEELLKGFCELNDQSLLAGRLNWDYVATNFIRYLQETYKKSLVDSNRVRITIGEEQVIYKYELKPKAELYKNTRIKMFETLTLSQI